MLRNALARLLFLVAIIGVPEKSSACGYHAAIGGGITVAHAASLPVAMAVHDALGSNRLAPLPELPPLLALARANGAMRTFASVLPPARNQDAAISLVMVESHLWGRAIPTAAGTRFEPHVDGPAPGDIVIVTSEPVLRALLGGRIGWETARAAGLIVVDGPVAQAEALSRQLGRHFAASGATPRHAATARRPPET